MPQVWMNVAEAAAAMKVHPRTVERRIAADKIESRRSEEGQVQILVNMPDSAPAASADSAVTTQAFETVRDLADRQVDIAAGSASALVHIAQEQTLRAESQLIMARKDAGRYRKEAQMALGLVAAMLLLVIVAVGWCAHTITAAEADARLSSDRAEKAAELARLAQTDRDNAQNRYDDAIIARAKAEGELTAYKTELTTVVEQTKKPVAPSTQPTLMTRLEQAFVGE
jgi:hypothetical protein